jgi:hypothetical protein
MFAQAKRALTVLVLGCCLLVGGCSSSAPSSSSSPAAGTPHALLSPAALTFASQPLGSTSASQAVTLSNTGTAALTVASVAASGDFAETNTCGSQVAAGSSCTISVTFTPTIVGTRSGSVTVSDSASGSPHSAGLSGAGIASTSTAGCVETGTSNFPGCFSLSSPTAVVAPGASAFSYKKAHVLQPRHHVVVSTNIQTQFAAQTAQLAALLDGTDPDPGQTLSALEGAVIDTSVGNITPTPDFCFGPSMYYANHPDGGTANFPATGRWGPGDLGIWLPTDAQGQACAAAELNYLLTSDSEKTQLTLAIAAEVQYLAGTNFPSTAGASYDATSAIAGLFSGAGAPVTVTAATVSFDGTSYLYSVQFSAPNTMSVPTACTLSLKHTPGATAYSYSGVAQYGFDDGTNLLAGTTRYQRTSQTHLDISARDTFYPSGATPQLDTNGELDPSDPNFYMRFSRMGASFDPTSALTPGSFLYVLQINAAGSYGPGAAQGLTDVFQLVLPGDGTGSAFYGFGSAAIDQPLAGTIDYMYCSRQSAVSQTYAQFQPIEYDDASSQYVPSSTVAAQIRFAPLSACTWTVAQWNNGDPSGFWYDRELQHTNDASQPTTPNPIPEYVVADPASTDYPFNLFGDGTTQPQTLIDAQGYTSPVLF